MELNKQIDDTFQKAEAALLKETFAALDAKIKALENRPAPAAQPPANTAALQKQIVELSARLAKLEAPAKPVPLAPTTPATA